MAEPTPETEATPDLTHTATDGDGQTLRDVLLTRLRWEYGEDAPWAELGSLTRLERDVRRWFKEVRRG